MSKIRKFSFSNLYNIIKNIFILVEKKFLDALLHVKSFQNLLMKIGDDIPKNSCFAHVENMLQC